MVWVCSRTDLAEIFGIAIGAVAQLGERCVRNAEVEGSTPFRSTCDLVGLSLACLVPADARQCSVFLKRRTVRAVLLPFENHILGPQDLRAFRTEYDRCARSNTTLRAAKGKPIGTGTL